MPPKQELLDKLAKELSKRIVDAIYPEAFLVYADDMRSLMECTLLLKQDKPLEGKEKQIILDNIMLMWRHCKPLTREDMNIIQHGIDLAEAEQQAEEIRDKDRH